MTTKFGLFSEPPYLKPGAGTSSSAPTGDKAEEAAKSGFRAGSGNKTGKVQPLTHYSAQLQGQSP